MSIVEIQGLNKFYGKFQAVENLNLTIEKGSIFGFLGHNGAGKTTTIKILTGQTSFSQGGVRVFNFDVKKQVKQIHQRIGVVSEEQNLYKNLTVFQNIDFYRKLYQLPSKRTYEIIELLDLKHKTKIKTDDLSKGLKQRVLLARSILHGPDLLFLDEPTSGLDPLSAQQTLNFIKELNRNGTTIFLTTHYMEEADSLCDDIAFIAKGKIVKRGSPKQLKYDYGVNEVVVEYTNGNDIFKQKFSLEDESVFSKIEKIRSQYQILAINTKEVSLRDIFLKLTKGEKL